MRLLGVLAICLLVVAGRAVAEEPSAAERVLAAFKAGDGDELKSLAASRASDPWLVADELCLRGELDAAEAFARAVPHKAVEGLPAYVVRVRSAGPRHEESQALAATNAALGKDDHTAALAAASEVQGALDSVVRMRLAYGRGLALAGLQRLVEAATAFRAAGEAARDVGWLTRAASAFRWAGQCSYYGGELQDAILAFQAAIALDTSLGEQGLAAKSLGNLGNAQLGLGDYTAALTAYEQARDAFRSLGDAAKAAGQLSNVGLVHQARGNYPTALTTLQHAREELQALAKEQAAAGEAGDTRATAAALDSRQAAAQALSNIGIAHRELGNYPQALAVFSQALQEQQALDQQRSAAGVLMNLGIVHMRLGDYDKALGEFKNALAEQERVHDRLGAATTLANIGTVHQRRGENAQASEVYQQALVVQEALSDRRGMASTLGEIGGIHLATGDPVKALGYFEKEVDLQEQLQDKVGIARAHMHLGLALVASGKDAEGVRELKRAVDHAESLRDRELHVATLQALARVYLDTGKSSKALARAREALRELEDLLGGLGEEEGATARGEHAELFSIGTLAAARDDDTEGALKFLESGRAGALLEALGGRQALRWSDVPEALREAEENAKVQARLARAELVKATQAENFPRVKVATKRLEAAIDGVRERAGQIQRALKAKAQLYYPRASPLDDIQEQLAPGQALVLYGLCLDEALAVVLTHDADRIVFLAKAAEVTGACETFRASAVHADTPAPLEPLRKLLVDPLRLGSDVKEVLVSPEGALCYAPLASLFDRPVTFTPSGTTHVLLRAEARGRGKGVLAMGNPDYAGASAGASAVYVRGRKLTPIPETGLEAQVVAQDVGDGDLVLLQAKANEGELRAALSGAKHWRAIHFACHGLVDPERPTLSALALTATEEDDGFLTALEVLRMDVHADLAVLSACETGTGRIVKGEGIVGLTRAFMYAGSPRVICSLWKVDDAATRALMQKFYEIWKPEKGPSAATALAEAQAFVRKEKRWEHPHFWAGWVLWGLPD